MSNERLDAINLLLSETANAEPDFDFRAHTENPEPSSDGNLADIGQITPPAGQPGDDAQPTACEGEILPAISFKHGALLATSSRTPAQVRLERCDD